MFNLEIYDILTRLSPVYLLFFNFQLPYRITSNSKELGRVPINTLGMKIEYAGLIRMSAHAPFTFRLLQAESRSMSVILFTRKHKSQRSSKGEKDVGGSVFGVGMSVCGRKDCQRLPCEMKHIITLRPAHVWDAGSRMPDAECPSLQLRPRGARLPGSRKKATRRGKGSGLQGKECGV